MKLAFVDCETTGTDPERHEAWEIAVIARAEARIAHPGSPDTYEMADSEWRWLVKPDLSRADAAALRIGRFYERTGNLPDEAGRPGGWWPPREAASAMAVLLDGAVLVAANPAFDAAFIGKFLRANGQCPAWDYHMTDIGSLVLGWRHGRHAGYLDVIGIVRESHRQQPGCEGVGTGEPYPHENAAPPLKVAHAASIVGLEPGSYAAHTALGDARMVRDIYDAVTGHG